MKASRRFLYAKIAFLILPLVSCFATSLRAYAQDDESSDSPITNTISSWKRHEALCHGSANCTVQFSDDGLKAGSLEIPAGRLAGWNAQDKSHKVCNMFGVCTRSVFAKERQEFLISYIDAEGKKSRIMIAFVNIKAALDFKQELESFAQLASATKGRKAAQYLSPQEAKSDILTSSAPSSSVNVPFNAWQEVSPHSQDGITYKRYFAIGSAKLIAPGVFEYPSLIVSSAGGKLYVAARIDCKRSLVTTMELRYEGVDQVAKNSWQKPSNIDPTNVAFEAAQKLCK